jgi:hypothetical protein
VPQEEDGRVENGLRGLGAAVWFLVCSMGAASAFSSPPSCDLVALRTTGAGGARLGDATWGTYRDALHETLRTAEARQIGDNILAQELIERQKAAVESVPAGALAAYRKSPECKVLGKLAPHAVSAFDNASALDPRFAPAAPRLQRLVKAALHDLQESLSSVRFRSAEQMQLFEAGYFCFIASLIHSASPPAGQRSLTLQSFGQTLGCADLKRTE